MRTILIIIFFLLPLLTRLFFYYDSRQIYKEGDNYEKSYSFMQEARKNDRSQYFFIDNILVTLPLYPSYSYGDEIIISGTIKKSSSERGELLIVENPKVEKVPTKNPLILTSKWVRGRIEESFLTAIPQREAGLLLGIILGVRDKIDRDFYEKLRITGVLHVVAASGQNVSIVAGILLISLQKIVKRRYAILFTGIGILFYSVLSGFDPPIVRASIMAMISFGAMILGRQGSGVVALLLTGWGMVMGSPQLLEDISFQLSFLSTFGILLIKPLLDLKLSWKRISLLRDDVTTTFSAQIATMPLILGVFGSYSPISLITNILILWSVPVIMITGGVAALLAIVSPVISYPVVLLIYPSLLFFNTVVEIFSRFDVLLHVENLPQTLIFGYYLILFGIVLGAYRRGGRKF